MNIPNNNRPIFQDWQKPPRSRWSRALGWITAILLVIATATTLFLFFFH